MVNAVITIAIIAIAITIITITIIITASPIKLIIQRGIGTLWRDRESPGRDLQINRAVLAANHTGLKVQACLLAEDAIFSST